MRPAGDSMNTLTLLRPGMRVFRGAPGVATGGAEDVERLIATAQLETQTAASNCIAMSLKASVGPF